MKISNNLPLIKTGQNNLAGKNKTPEFTEPVDTFTFSGTFVGAPDKSAGGWILDRKFVGAPDRSAGGWVKDEEPSNYPGDAIGFGSGR